MANNAFQKNHKLMKKLGMPSFGDMKLNEEGSKFAASSSVAYTYDGFFNRPHGINGMFLISLTSNGLQPGPQQLNTKTANIFENIPKNDYLGAHDGNVDYIVATAKQQIAAKKTCQ
ncbi:hypothetical protein MJO28_008021 [Puccinia striiformis f. sp. tritici]|nr:hypothetical protein MJO28_008016 [Puccinia striiformis f. sp. tritici]KAI7949200.1 hypothetical protein MJO28_008021 [Puccinia striiformis f. sp. tritici]KAI7952322.1 hypothetical protein MJO29_007953 [Puccinia striiformis f. sp. tritici]POW00805.1 hypothetical protein PSTT_12906 [Puccinia striiformis]